MSFLLLPGPTSVPHEVAMVGAAPMVNHRGPEFKATFQGMDKHLKNIFKTKNDILTFTCSGSGGMEAGFVNFVNPGDKVLIASIGNFGNRFKDIAERYNAKVEFVDFGWGNHADPAVIKEHLDKDTNHEIKAVFVQQNETSTAIVNPIKEIGEAMGDHPALFIVDAVSGLAAADLETDAWGIDVVIAGSQKAFMSPPGVAMLAVNEKALEVAKNNTNSKFYFDVVKAKNSLDKGQTPFTPAIGIIAQVALAAEMIDEKGIDNVIAEHYLRRDMLRAAAKAINLDLVVKEDKYSSPAVTAFYSPKGFSPQDFRKEMNDKYNIIVAGGQGKFSDSVFRIGHLGNVDNMEIIATVGAMEMVLKKAGQDIELGKGVAAAQEVLLANQ